MFKKILINSLGKSPTLKINDLSNELVKKGKKIYKFGFGQSPFPVPTFLNKSLQKHSHRKEYIEVLGLKELRQSIANHYSNTYNIDLNYKNVIIGPGTKQLLFLLQNTLNTRVNIISPSWVSYINQSKILNSNYNNIITNFENNWYPEKIKDLNLNSKDLLILNYPNNPTGIIRDFKDISNSLKKLENPLVLSDEIYSYLNFENKVPDTMLKHYPNTIVSNGISKWCGAGGWRLGWMILPNNLRLVKHSISDIGSELYSSVNAPVQYACLDLFNNFNQIESYLQKCNMCLKILSNEINNIFDKSKIKYIKPNGGFYYFIDMSEYSDKFHKIGIFTDVELNDKILEDTGVAILAGSYFGLPNKTFTARLSFVDFNGEDIINNQLNDSEILEICNKTLEGCKILTDYIENL